jgi:hypothetical protein
MKNLPSKKRSYKKTKNKSQTVRNRRKKPAVKHQILLNRACKYDKTIWDGNVNIEELKTPKKKLKKRLTD